MFDEDEEKKRKEQEGALLQTTKEGVVEQPSLEALKEGRSTWDTVKNIGGQVVDSVGDATSGALSYMMDDEAEFKRKWMAENMPTEVGADRDPAKIAALQKQREEEAKSAWSQRQINRKLIGGALGGVVGGLGTHLSRKGNSGQGSSGVKSYSTGSSSSSGGGKLGTGFVPNALRRG